MARVQHVQLSYAFGARTAGSAALRNPLMELLQAVHDTGSISAAARALDLSYRHVWGELKRWEGVLGQALVAGEPGQPAQLSAFGSRLLRAERQAQARLAPQLAALQAELARAMALALAPDGLTLHLHASHDDALEALREHAAASAQLHLDIHYTGSADALRDLHEGRCSLAAFPSAEHPSPGSLAEGAGKPWFDPQQHRLIGFVRRNQGLMLAPGNPLALHSLADAARVRARCARRAPGSSTRLLFDDLLAQAGLPATALQGDAQPEPSHAAVAQAVQSGRADIGLGLESAARRAGLDFVPLMTERYRLVCLASALAQPALQALLALLQTPLWRRTLGALPGYADDQGGKPAP